MIGFAAKTAIVLWRRFDWRCSLIAIDRDPSTFAVSQNFSLCLPGSLQSFVAVAARAAESAVQFLCGPAVFVDTPGVIG
jgi:hypothetical protein